VEPDVPVAFAHLLDWTWELHGRSGVAGMGGVAPLSPTTLRDWQRLKRIRLSLFEIDALFSLDAVLRTAGKGDAPLEPTPAAADGSAGAGTNTGGVRGSTAAWPSRRTP